MELKKNLPFVLTLCGAVAGLYGQFLWSPLVFDDLPDRNGSFSPFSLRSLPYATLEWGMELFDREVTFFRIESLCLHAAVAIALFFFLKVLFERVIPARSASSLSLAMLAFFAALLFALHPVSVYAAGYLVQRTIVMATLFSLLAMIVWIRGLERSGRGWLWLSVFFFYLAVLSKEHAIMLPAVLCALTVMLREDWLALLKRRWPVLLALLAIAIWVMMAKKGLLGTVYEIYAPDMLEAPDANLNYPLSVLTQSWMFFKYAALWLFPNPNWMSVDMREPFAGSLWSGYLAAFVAFLAWGALAVWLLFKRGRWSLLGFALLFPWLMFLPEFSTVRIQESFVLYRSYLWAVGACAVLPLLLGRLDKNMGGIILGAIALAMMPISLDRLASFAHPLILWDDAAKLVIAKPELPGVYRIYYNRGTERLKVDDYDGAIEDLKLSVKLQPDWVFAYNNLGVAYGKKWEWIPSVDFFSQAIEVAQRKQMGFNPTPYLGRAVSYEQMGRADLARKDYELTCKLANKGCEKLVGPESSDLSKKNLHGTKAAH